MLRTTLVLLVSLVLPLAGCGGGGGSAPATGPDDPGAPTDFTTFVKTLFDQTDDVSDPVDLDNVAFTGTDNEDETAYDDVLAANGG